jgi:threonine aldolase
MKMLKGVKTLLLEAYKLTLYQLVGHGVRNTEVLKRAFEEANGEQDSDIYGNGKVIEDFEMKLAKFLGKESAVFFPSGTMAQQIALRIWCDQQGLKRVAYHPLCHLEIHEEDGLKELHHIDPILLADKDRVIRLEDVVNLKEDIACLLLELPQREIGGQLPDYQTIESISAYCREKGIKLHLDGARLYEILPYYKKSAAEICALFDSVYVSLYKGIGGVAGAILAGEKTFTKESKVWKRRHGGDLISLYPYIITADFYFNKRIQKMEQFFEEANELAELFNQCEAVTTVPQVPVSNMFHVHFHAAKEKVEPILVGIYRDTGIGFTSNLRERNEGISYFELSIGDQYSKIPKESLQKAFQLLDEKMRYLINDGHQSIS